jgi:hypothetical protein
MKQVLQPLCYYVRYVKREIELNTREISRDYRNEHFKNSTTNTVMNNSDESYISCAS